MAIKTKGPAVLRETADVPASPLLSNAALKRIYAAMLHCRALEERAALLFQRWRIPPNASSPAFQEALKVGCVIDLLPEDRIASPHPEFSAHFLHGLPLDAVLSRSFAWRGEVNGTVPARPGQEPLLAGVRMANKLKKSGHVVVAFSPPHASRLPHEALRRVRFESLPIVFVLDNRLPFGTGPAPRVGAKKRTVAARNYGFPCIPVDGNDAVAVYRVAHEAVTRARRGDGPTVMECKTYCLDYPLHGAGKVEGSRDYKDERDPIQRMEQYLKDKGLFQAAWKSQVIQRFSRRLDGIVIAAEPNDSPRPIEHAS